MVPIENFVATPSPSKRSLADRIGLVIPTWNAGGHWSKLDGALRKQGIPPDRVLIIDSSSSDDTRSLVRRAGYGLKVIPKESFSHAGTRQMAAGLMPNAEILVYLTQDAVLADERSLENLVAAFDDPKIGGSYGRQLPRAEAGPIEEHARLFNYPGDSAHRTFEDRHKLGIRAAFFSNSFAAYRRTAFEEVGGFPIDALVSEDASVAARMLMAGWDLAYQADATVIHSHDFTLQQEFSRYFDTGVHHGREHWILEEFGGAGREGRKFVLSEARFLLQCNPSLLPLACVRNANKWCAYFLGAHEHYLPVALKKMLSAQKGFWRKELTSHVAYRDVPSLASSATEGSRTKW